MSGTPGPAGAATSTAAPLLRAPAHGPAPLNGLVRMRPWRSPGRLVWVISCFFFWNELTPLPLLLLPLVPPPRPLPDVSHLFTPLSCRLPHALPPPPDPSLTTSEGSYLMPTMRMRTCVPPWMRVVWSMEIQLLSSDVSNSNSSGINCTDQRRAERGRHGACRHARGGRAEDVDRLRAAPPTHTRFFHPPPVCARAWTFQHTVRHTRIAQAEA